MTFKTVSISRGKRFFMNETDHTTQRTDLCELKPEFAPPSTHAVTVQCVLEKFSISKTNET